jgi:hypothetical protein
MAQRAGVALSRLAFDATYTITRVSGAPGPAVFTPPTSHTLSNSSSIPEIMTAFTQAVDIDLTSRDNKYAVAYPIGASSEQRKGFYSASMNTFDHFHAWANGYGVKSAPKEEKRGVRFLFVDLTAGQGAAKMAVGNYSSRGWTYKLQGDKFTTLSEEQESELQGWTAQEVFDKLVQPVIPDDGHLDVVGILRPEGSLPSLVPSELESKLPGVTVEWVSLSDISHGTALVMNREPVYDSDDDEDGPGRTYLPTGVRLANGQVVTILHANAYCPIDRKVVFTTSQDDQTSVTVNVLMGTTPFGEPITLQNITPKPKGEARIRVKYDVSEYGGATCIVEEVGKESERVRKTFGSALSYYKAKIDAYKAETTNKQVEMQLGTDGVVGELPP